MLTHIDHVIIGVADLDVAAVYTAKLGLHISGGGTHPGRGTANHIIVLDPEYLELIGVTDPETLTWKALQGFVERGGGLFNIAFSSDDVDADTERLRGAGLQIEPPTDGALVSPQGKRRGWRSAMVAGEIGGGLPLPFIIQHDSTGDAKRHRLAGDNTLEAHPLGATRVAWVGYAVAKMEAGLALFRDGYGLTDANERLEDGRQMADVAVLRLPGGDAIRLLAAHDGTGPVADAAKRNSAPYELALEVTDLKAATAWLTAHGVSSAMLPNNQAYLDPTAVGGLRVVLVEA